ncbi:MAG TPA: AsmA family protein [Gammaproteobacteria bacterium]
MRALKIAGIVVAVLAVVLVAAVLVVASRFDPNDYKDEVARLVEQQTGRALTIEQDLTLSFFPWLAVETGGVTLGDSPQFAAAGRPFLTAERVAARVRLLPLLGGDIEIGVVELEGLELNLARDAELRGNWEDLLARGGAEAREEAPADGAEAPRRFRVAGVRVTDGTVRWHENVDELRYTVSGLDIETGALAGGEPVELELEATLRDSAGSLVVALAAAATAELGEDGSFAARGLEVEFTAGDAAAPTRVRGTLDAADIAADAAGTIRVADLALDASLPHPLTGDGTVSVALSVPAVVFDPAAQTLTIDRLTTTAGGVAADWRIAARSLLDAPAVDGAVTSRGTAAALLELLAMTPPAGVDPASLGDFTLRSDFAVALAPRRVSVSGFEVAALGFTARGEGSLDETNRLQGRVEVPQFTPSTAVQALLRAAVPPTVDVSALGDLALAARFDTDLATGRASITELSAAAFGATLTGEIEAAPGDNGAVYRGALATSRFAPDRLVQAFAAFMPETVAVDELGMVQLDTRFAYDTARGDVTFAPFSAELFGLRARGEVSGRGVTTAATWTGRAQLEPFSPRDLMRRFGQEVPATSDPRALGRAAIDTRFAVDVQGEQARFEDLVLELDDSRIAGSFAVVGFESPRYRFALAIDAVNADRYLPPPADEAEAGEKTAGDIELPTETPLVLDGEITVGALTLAGLSFQDVGTRIALGGGEARLDGARAKLYGGAFEGSFHATLRGEPGLILQGRATGLDLEPLIQALTREPANFSGKGDFDLALSGRGATVIDNVRTAGGNVSFAMRDGEIRGFNLGRTLCAAYNLTQQAPGPQGQQPNATSYVVIQGTATVADGVAHSSDLLARTTFMDVTGRGSLVLVEQRLDYDFDATLTGKIDIPGCQTMESLIGQSLPLDIRGTVTEPDIRPDFSEILKRRAEEELRERLQERLQDRLQDRLRDLLR